MGSPNTAQYQPPKDTNHAQDVEVLARIVGVASETTQLTPTQLVVEVVPPASGVHTVKLPPLHTWQNKIACIYQTITAPGGEVKVEYSESATDAIGDNLTAANDHALFLNLQGRALLVIKEVTT